MTPQEHIRYAEECLSNSQHSFNFDNKTALATMALAHIEIAKWKENHDTHDS